MTDLVEVMARAYCRAIGKNPDDLVRAGFSERVTPPRGYVIFGESYKPAKEPRWRKHALLSRDITQALNDAGYAVVPREPTKKIIDVGRVMFWCGGNQDGEPSPDEATDMAYRAMIAAEEE